MLLHQLFAPPDEASPCRTQEPEASDLGKSTVQLSRSPSREHHHLGMDDSEREEEVKSLGRTGTECHDRWKEKKRRAALEPKKQEWVETKVKWPAANLGTAGKGHGSQWEHSVVSLTLAFRERLSGSAKFEQSNSWPFCFKPTITNGRERQNRAQTKGGNEESCFCLSTLFTSIHLF